MDYVQGKADLIGQLSSWIERATARSADVKEEVSQPQIHVAATAMVEAQMDALMATVGLAATIRLSLARVVCEIVGFSHVSQTILKNPFSSHTCVDVAFV